MSAFQLKHGRWFRSNKLRPVQTESLVNGHLALRTYSHHSLQFFLPLFFMPSCCCFFFFVLLLFYSQETQKKNFLLFSKKKIGRGGGGSVVGITKRNRPFSVKVSDNFELTRNAILFIFFFFCCEKARKFDQLHFVNHWSVFNALKSSWLYSNPGWLIWLIFSDICSNRFGL